MLYGAIEYAADGVSYAIIIGIIGVDTSIATVGNAVEEVDPYSAALGGRRCVGYDLSDASRCLAVVRVYRR